MRTTYLTFSLVICGTFTPLLSVESALAQQASGVEVSSAVSNAVSQPVRDMPGRVSARVSNRNAKSHCD